MGRVRKFLAIIGVATIGVIACFAAWFAPSLPTGIAQDSTRPNLQPLISRGYTDAPGGTVTVAGDPLGGATLIELRIKDGQTVKEGEIIGVLSEHPRADIAVRTAQASLEKLLQMRETMTKGSRVTEIAMAEDNIAQTIERNKLKVLELQRSGKPPDQKEIELSLAEQNLEKQKTNLVLQKQTLASDLTINALDAMPLGGKLTVVVRATSAGGAEVCIRDTGAGISEEIMPRLFQPFVSGKDTGLGLGLVISRRILENHGGTIWAGNAAEGGAVFIISLPAG